jgi:hypothetical protein
VLDSTQGHKLTIVGLGRNAEITHANTQALCTVRCPLHLLCVAVHTWLCPCGCHGGIATGSGFWLVVSGLHPHGARLSVISDKAKLRLLTIFLSCQLIHC